MIGGETPPPSRLARDVTALVLVCAGAGAVIWAAAATDWRLLLGFCGMLALAVGVVLGRGE